MVIKLQIMLPKKLPNLVGSLNLLTMVGIDDKQDSFLALPLYRL